MDFPKSSGHITRAPDGRTQSYLEGLFNPGSDYGECTYEIARHLITSDLNAMRCASSTMNTALTSPNQARLDYRLVTKGTCDAGAAVHAGGFTCINLPNSRVLIKYCEDCATNTPPTQTRICAVCRRRWLQKSAIRRVQLVVNGDGWNPESGNAQADLCHKCVKTAQSRYPDGIDLCKCVANLLKLSLCLDCFEGRRVAMRDQMNRRRRDLTALQDETVLTCIRCDGRVKWSFDPRTRICLLCEQLILIKTHVNRRHSCRNNPKLGTNRRRSSRITPQHNTAENLIMLPYAGRIRIAEPKPQNKTGFQPRVFPRGKHAV